MRRTLFRTFVAVVSMAGILLGTQTAAQADDHYGNTADAWVQQLTDTGLCEAKVHTTYFDGKRYAYGQFINSFSGIVCTGWLERSTNSGSSWGKISGNHPLPGTGVHPDSTGKYFDGPDYLARACFKFSFSGAATHCSWAR